MKEKHLLDEYLRKEEDKRAKRVDLDNLFSYDLIPISNFVAIKIGLASPETIRSWSHGEVKKPETINYRNFKAERDGLFCERIFGPTEDWKCYCGKYKSSKYQGVICDRCGVEIIRSDVRRYRMGHIELAAPVVHIWYISRTPSPIALLLNISTQEVLRVTYYESYIVLDPKDAPIPKFAVITQEQYAQLITSYPNIKVNIGGEGIKEALASLQLDALHDELLAKLKKESSAQTRKKLIKRLELIKAFLQSSNKPEWMVLEVLPVIPPELRPMVQLEGGKYATSDLNDLYRRVINRNNRLLKLIELEAPDIIIRNEKRMLQEAVDALLDNEKRAKPLKTITNRALKSLSEIFRGKSGRFRQNLLGKRVDYSGRSVIVVDPKLKLHHCGLPICIALELFKPFLMYELISRGIAPNIKAAKKLIDQTIENPSKNVELIHILEDIVVGHHVLLNRAPTLHRAGIQAFEIKLVPEEAIKIHPFVCPAFNADFDGDQMAVHLPISWESQLEARLLMLSSYNLLSLAHGKPLLIPSQDVILGLHYLTKESGETKPYVFSSYQEAIYAFETNKVKLHTKVKFFTDSKIIETTVGRIIFNQTLPKPLGFVNTTLNKQKILDIIERCYREVGAYETTKFLDAIKDIGFHFATQAGITFSIQDVKIPPEKGEILKEANLKLQEIKEEYKKGVLTNEERYNKEVDLWTLTNERITQLMLKDFEEDMQGFNPIHMMLVSAARGSKDQIAQLGGMRSLMTKPSGEIIELPITSNFREGLSVLEYFISTHGARKGLADTALKTADAGYLTRRLVDVAHEITITEKDCGTLNGIVIEPLRIGDEILLSLKDRILGRIALEDIIDPASGEVIVRREEEIDEAKAEKIEEAELERIAIRSVLTCELESGVCAKCYGRNLGTGRLVDLSESVGIIAAQSIGEPGTQLTMRTFHIGGIAARRVEEHYIKFPYPVMIEEVPHRLVKRDTNEWISLRDSHLTIRKILYALPLQEKKDIKILQHDGMWVNVNEKLAVYKEDGIEKEILASFAGIVRLTDDSLLLVATERNIPIKTGSKIFVTKGECVKENTTLAEIDPYNEPILTEIKGKLYFKDIAPERTLKEELDENTGLFRRVVIEDREGELLPRVLIVPEEGSSPVTYYIPHGATLVASDGDEVNVGDILAKFPQEQIRTKDITGGLPRVTELFEGRQPKNPALISEIDGVVKFKEITGGIRTIHIENPTTGDKRVYLIPVSKHLKIHDNDYVRAGDQLTEGSINLVDLLRIKGVKHLQKYLLNEIQTVYRLQGVTVNDKHIEIIIRQMLRKVEVINPGDTELLQGQIIDRSRVEKINKEMIKLNLKPAEVRIVLMGITRAALSTESFISAASFQETTRVLTEAALNNKVDELHGLKENVILGKLIPVGTGASVYRLVKSG